MAQEIPPKRKHTKKSVEGLAREDYGVYSELIFDFVTNTGEEVPSRVPSGILIVYYFNKLLELLMEYWEALISLENNPKRYKEFKKIVQVFFENNLRLK